MGARSVFRRKVAVDGLKAESAHVRVFGVQLELNLARYLDSTPSRAMLPRESGNVQLLAPAGPAYIDQTSTFTQLEPGRRVFQQ